MVEPPHDRDPPRIEKSTGGAYWTDFRGPKRDGRYEEMPIAIPAEREKPVWKQPIGGGYASFVVAHGRAFTIEQRRRQEVATAYDLATGRELWAHGWDAEFRETMGGDGPRACPTWHDGKVYALGAAGELRCLDARTGKRIWSRNILARQRRGESAMGHGRGAADRGRQGHRAARRAGGQVRRRIQQADGEPVWKALDDKASYVSPMLVTLAGKRQLLIVTARRMMGLTVEDGSLLWEYPWTTEYDINAAQPLVIGENRVFISAGYGHGAAVVEITPAE